MALELMYITNMPDIAKIAELAGVNRIWIDLETMGKAERQRNYNSVKSQHSLEDVARIKPLLTCAKLQVRVNPMNSNSKYEIAKAIEYGADVLVLPMFTCAKEVEAFIDFVDGKTKTLLLLETKEAVDCLDDILAVQGIDEVHIGLNDLHISLKKHFMFELLIDGVVEGICKKLKAYGIPFGIGGVARLGVGMLPAEFIITEHYRLGSEMAILSRSFYNTEDQLSLYDVKGLFEREIGAIRSFEKKISLQNKIFFDDNHKTMRDRIESIVAKM